MTYTAQERKIIHQQLVGAKKHLCDGTNPYRWGFQQFICIAVKTYVEKINIVGDWRLTADMIEQRLGADPVEGPRTVREWLCDVAEIPAHELTYLAIQTYRHEWLDQLIEEFSK